MQLGRGVSIIASYVAITRVETKEQLLIYRRFDLEPFSKGPLEGPTLLLQKLRGEVIDWKIIEEKHKALKKRVKESQKLTVEVNAARA